VRVKFKFKWPNQDDELAVARKFADLLFYQQLLGNLKIVTSYNFIKEIVVGQLRKMS